MKREFDPAEYNPKDNTLTGFARRLALPLVQAALAVNLGISARNGDESSRMKIDSVAEDSQRRGLSPWWLSLARRIAGR